MPCLINLGVFMPVSLLPATLTELNFWEIFKFKWICCEIFISGYNNILYTMEK